MPYLAVLTTWQYSTECSIKFTDSLEVMKYDSPVVVLGSTASKGSFKSTVKISGGSLKEKN